MEPLLRLGRALAGETPSSPLGWDDLLVAARAARLEPVLLHVQRERLPPAHRAQLEAQTRRIAFANLYADGERRRVLEALGPDTVVLKGAVLETLTYPAEVPRSTNDLDVLVAPEEAASAEAALLRLGYQPVPLFHPDRPASAASPHERLYTRELVTGRVRQSLELHTALCQPFLHHLPVSSLLSRSLPFEEGRRLDDVDQLIHLAVHLGKEQFLSPAKHLFDLHLWVQRGLDWTALRARCEATRTMTVVYEALRLAAAVFGTPVPADFLAAARPGVFAAAWLAAWRRPRGTRLVAFDVPMRVHQLATGLLQLDSVADAKRAVTSYAALRLADLVHPRRR